MDESIRTALTDQLTRCEARCARLTAELESVTAAMQQSDAANVALAGKLEATQRKLTDLIEDVRGWNIAHGEWHDLDLLLDGVQQ